MKQKWIDAALYGENVVGGPWSEQGQVTGQGGLWQAASVPTAVELTTWDPWKKSGGPVLPLTCLPPTFASWARARAEETGADVSAFAVAALQLISGAVDHGTRVIPKQHEKNFAVRPTMWSMLVNTPSSKKSLVVREVQGRLKWIEREFAKHRQVIVGILTQQGDKDAEKNVPPARRLLANDTTIEKLADILSRQDSGISTVRDEISSWLGGMERYRGGGERGFWLEAHDGGSFTIDRVERGSRFVDCLSTSVFGGIQPDRLARFPDLTEDGLFQRFLPVVMRDATAQKDQPGDATLETKFSAMIMDIARLGPMLFRLEQLASDEWMKFANEMSALAGITMPSRDFGTFLGKQARTLAMLTLLLHIADIADPASDRNIAARENDGQELPVGSPAGSEGAVGTVEALARKGGVADGPLGSARVTGLIPLVTLLRAKRILEKFFVPHAMALYAQAGAVSSDTINIATALLKLAGEGAAKVTLRDLMRRTQAIRKIGSDDRKVAEALALFVANGWIGPEEDQPHNRVWDLNAKLKGHLDGEMRKQVEMHEAIAVKIRDQSQQK